MSDIQDRDPLEVADELHEKGSNPYFGSDLRAPEDLYAGFRLATAISTLHQDAHPGEGEKGTLTCLIDGHHHPLWIRLNLQSCLPTTQLPLLHLDPLDLYCPYRSSVDG